MKELFFINNEINVDEIIIFPQDGFSFADLVLDVSENEFGKKLKQMNWVDYIRLRVLIPTGTRFNKGDYVDLKGMLDAYGQRTMPDDVFSAIYNQIDEWDMGYHIDLINWEVDERTKLVYQVVNLEDY